MAASKKSTHTVKHRRLYLAVKGKMEHVAEGTQLALTEDQAKGLGRKVSSLSGVKSLDLEPDAGKSA